jgi:hypothetical protein
VSCDAVQFITATSCQIPVDGSFNSYFMFGIWAMYHVKWAPCDRDMALPQVAAGLDGLQTRRVAVNIRGAVKKIDINGLVHHEFLPPSVSRLSRQ